MSNADASEVSIHDTRFQGLVPSALCRHLLLLRFCLFNLVAFALLFATLLQGWLHDAFGAETLWPILIICAVFCYGLLLCALGVRRVDGTLERIRSGVVDADTPASDYLRSAAVSQHDLGAASNLLRLRLTHPISTIRHVANALVFLGLIGTVVGFIVALSAVKPELSSSVETVAPMVATLITGMSIALYTTLMGAVLHIWLMVCYRMLVSGTFALFDCIVAMGEDRVGR